MISYSGFNNVGYAYYYVQKGG